jgi:hypothetical protein
VIYKPQKGWAFRITVSAFQNSGVGPYALTIREFVD